MTDPYDLLLEKLDAESICCNGWCCDHPYCPDHNPMPGWNEIKEYWPVAMDAETHSDALMNDRREQ